MLNIELREPKPQDFLVGLSDKNVGKILEEEIKTEELEKENVHALLKRASEINIGEVKEKEFFRGEKSAPVPKTGKIAKLFFPPQKKEEKPKELILEEETIKKELKILRYMPEGNDIEIIPQVVVSFNQPMIPLTSIEELKEKDIPMHIEPKTEGEWRWIGTKTIQWKPKYRLPKSTSFKVTVPAETKSEYGCKLQEEFSFSFKTSNIKIENSFPFSTIGEKGIFFIRFNQKIKKEEVLNNCSFISNNKEQEIQLLSPKEVESAISEGKVMETKRNDLFTGYKTCLNNKDNLENSIWFKSKQLLEKNQSFKFVVKKGSNFGEGKNPTPEDQESRTFKTYQRMEVKDIYPKSLFGIVPRQNWSIYFSNNIELDEFDKNMVKIEPEIEDVEIKASKDHISIQGNSRGRTTYKVTLMKEIKDVFGQNLFKETTKSFKVGSANPLLHGFFDNKVITIDPTEGQDPSFSFASMNIDKVRLVVLQVEVAEFHLSPFGGDYYYQKIGYNERNIEKKMNCGRIVFDNTITIDGEKDTIIETKINLTPYLQFPKEKLGQLIVYVENYNPIWKFWKRNNLRTQSWIQCTNLAVQTHCVVNREMISHLSSLKDGSSISKGKISIIPRMHKKSTFEDYKNKTLNVETDEHGIVSIDTKKNQYRDQNIVAAQKGNDICFVSNISFFPENQDKFLTYIVDDRGLYKPKEEVSIKILVRKLVFKGDLLKKKMIEFPKKGTKVEFEVFDARGSKVHSGKFELDENGSYFLKFKIPDDANLGDARISFNSIFYASHTFKIQEFRTPEFTCSVQTETSGPHFVNSSAIVKGVAEYYAGGFLSDAKVHYSVSQSSSSFKPPSWSFRDLGNWKFQSDFLPLTKTGKIVPLLPTFSREFKGITDGSGKHKLCVDFKLNPEAKKISPTSINVNCDFQDINRQTISGSTNFIVHPSNLYLGLKLGKRFVKVNDTLPLDVIVTNIDGIEEEGKNVEIKIIKRISCQEKYRHFYKDKILETIKLVSSKTPVCYNIKIKEGGDYHIVGTVVDENGCKNRASQSIWIPGEITLDTKSKSIQQENIKMIANAKEYKIGECCKILINSPLYKDKDAVEGFYFVYTDSGIEERHPIKLEKGETAAVINVPIKNTNYYPNFKVKVELTGVQKRIDETGRINEDSTIRPAFASGSLLINVPPKGKELEIEIKNKEIMIPGESSRIDVQLKGKKVEKSKVSLIIVDEAVLSLTGYSISNPLYSFYQSGYLPHQKKDLRSTIYVKDWNSLHIQTLEINDRRIKCKKEGCWGGCSKSLFSFQTKSHRRCECCCSFSEDCCTKVSDCFDCCIGGECDMPEASPNEGKTIAVRSNFNPLACFINDQETDENGKVSINFTLPDNLTRYRVWVLATNQADQFGFNESFIKAQLPIAIRPSVPRFFNFGDQSYCSIVLQNQTSEEIEVFVACKVNEKLKFGENTARGYKCLIPFNKRKEIRFFIETKNVGTGKIQFITSTKNGNFSDAIEKEIPIYQPATTEAFATYGEIDDDGTPILQQIQPPKDVFKEFGGLKVSLSSTALQSLTDAFLYLYNYKFDCVEQICSRMLSIFALQDVLFAFNVPNLPKIKDLEKIVKTGEKKIKAIQRSNGAIGFWTLFSDVNVYLSIHVSHCLIRGIQQGYKIDQLILSRGKTFCLNIEQHVDIFWNRYYTKSTKASLIAFACYTLTQFDIAGELSENEKTKVLKKCEKLWKIYEKELNFEGKLWLIFAIFQFSPKKENNEIIKSVLKELQNKINETPQTANIITNYGDKSTAKLIMLHSNRRTDAICLEVLIHIDPTNYLIPKFVKGLLASKKKGSFGSTQENVYVLLSLKQYFQKYENITPDFIAKIWLGENFGGEIKFKGRSTKTKLLEIPMKYLLESEEEAKEEEKEKEKEKQLCLVKNGKGRLYFRLGLDYSPKSIELKAIDYGFKVERVYEGVTDSKHAIFDKNKNCWIFKAGELIRCRLKMINNSVRYHVALVDFLPAGCEALNPELKGTSKEAQKEANENNNRGTSNNSWWSWYYRPWYCHHNIRDERVEAFATNLYCGEHKFSYLMRATSFGTYIIPPCKAEEMYSPELFGRSKTEKVIIQ